MENIYTLSRVGKSFPGQRGKPVTILHDVSLEIRRGEIFAFLGASGSGKSTILRLMTGLDAEFSGTITRAPDIAPSDIGFIFQQFALLPWKTVSENIELWLIARNMPEHERKRRVSRELETLKLTAAAHQYPHELSGGMRQRVGIARALSIEPKVIFMDEAFSELDSFTAKVLRAELLSIWQERKMTIVMVTHILDEAVELADRVAVLTGRPARVENVIHNPLGRPRQPRTYPFWALEDKIFNIIKSEANA